VIANMHEHKGAWMNFKAVDNKKSSCTVVQGFYISPRKTIAATLYLLSIFFVICRKIRFPNFKLRDYKFF